MPTLLIINILPFVKCSLKRCGIALWGTLAEQNVIYVNKAHSTYRTEALRGAALLLRHVVRLVSKVIALEKYPEGREALELQNRLIAEAIRLTQPQTGESRCRVGASQDELVS